MTVIKKIPRSSETRQVDTLGSLRAVVEAYLQRKFRRLGADLDDVVQEALLVAWQNAENVEQLKPYTLEAARRRALQVLKSRDVRLERIDFDAEVAELLDAVEPEEQLDARSKLALIGSMNDRDVQLTVEHAAGCTQAEIAARIDRHERVVWVGVERGREYLQKMFGG